MDFTSFNQFNDTYVANTQRKELPNLPPGSYRLEFNQQTGDLYFKRFDPKYDQLIDLPSPEYDYAMRRVNAFLEAEGQARFKEYNYLYKLNMFLHGTHGTGKTCIVNRVGQKVVEKGGVILFNPHPQLLQMAFKVLEDIQPGRTTMVIFEEFETLLEQFEGAMLSLLDGEIQKDNVMFFATTNHFNMVPARFKRPGRFPIILEVKYPNPEAREHYLKMKLKESDYAEIPAWVKATDGLSIDELKETVLSVKCFLEPLKSVVERIKDTKKRAQNDEEERGQWSGMNHFNVEPLEVAMKNMEKARG